MPESSRRYMEKCSAAPTGTEDDEERDIFDEYVDSIFEMSKKRTGIGQS